MGHNTMAWNRMLVTIVCGRLLSDNFNRNQNGLYSTYCCCKAFIALTVTQWLVTTNDVIFNFTSLFIAEWMSGMKRKRKHFFFLVWRGFLLAWSVQFLGKHYLRFLSFTSVSFFPKVCMYIKMYSYSCQQNVIGTARRQSSTVHCITVNSI